MIYLVALVAGIALATANTTPVQFVYLPANPLVSSEAPSQTQLPLYALLLGFLVIGAFVAGTGTFVEHVRLRFLVRRNAKVVKGLRADLDKARAALEQAETALATRTAELASEQARSRRAEEAEAKAVAAAGQERGRADEAVNRLPPPPGA